jgi:hypothetical protein
MRARDSIASLAACLVIACGGERRDGDSSSNNGLSGYDADVTTDASVSLDADCPEVDFTARLAAARKDCSAPMPTGSAVPLASFVLGRWLWCPNSSGAPIYGPPGSVGVELATDGVAHFLRLACDGTVVRGSGGRASDAEIETWENPYELLDGDEIQISYDKTPTSEMFELGVVTEGDDPKRMWIDDMGVVHTMYVVAPDRI